MSAGTYYHAADRVRDGLLARYSDLLLVAGIVAIVALMVLPLPVWVIDVLVAANIASGLVLLLMAVYIGGVLDFSVFPSVLLMTTLFRLALSIATTRMILLHADGGHIIATFGKMVAGGNLVVGLVVFLIITVVQFIVIAKGAERVAEVAARFSLDAMPGKQLSIDSDLRSGLIDKDEARRRRRALEMESKLHGSLDGAMKFVKGDAIAGIVIIAINLLGGLAIGVLQQDMALGEAMHRYSILTIGDGMVTQIPALLGAMAAGLIVTRTTDAESDLHLGDSIRKQLLARPRVQLVAGGICLLLAWVPGFPALVFVGIGLVALAFGVALTPGLRARVQPWARRVWPAGAQRSEPGVLRTEPPPARPSLPLLLSVPTPLLLGEGGARLRQTLQTLLDDFQLTLGLPLPRIVVHGQADAQTWTLLAYEVPLAEGPCASDQPQADLTQGIRAAIARHAPMFIGIQETTQLLTRAAGEVPDVVKEVLRHLPTQRVAEVLRRLVAEQVSIRNLRDVLEALAEAGQREKDVAALTELSRIALRRQISHRVAPAGTLAVLVLEPSLETALREAVHVQGGVSQLALDPQVARRVLDAVSERVRAQQPAALLCAIDVRWHVRKLIEPEHFDLPVLSYHELMPTLALETRGQVPLPDAALLEAA